MNSIFILLVILTSIRLWIAIQLFLTARKSNLDNLYWLAGLFALAIYSLFTPLSSSPLGNYWIFHLGFIAGHFCLAMFIHTTFHRDRKSPIYIVLGLLVVAFFVDIYALSVGDNKLAGMMASIGLVNWTWHLVIAWQAYGTVATDPNVEDWVKSRYQLMLTYIPLIILSTIQVVASSSNLSSLVPTIAPQIGLLLIIASIILQFLVWVMPEPFRRWLNRKQQIHTEKFRQAQAEAMIGLVTSALTEITGQSTQIALSYAIRASIGKIIGTDESTAVAKHVASMGYHEWDTLLQREDLHKLITNSGGANVYKAIENARKMLVEKQSLFTMQAK